MQSLLNEQLKNKLSSEEQEAKLRKAQLKTSTNNSNSSPGKTSLTANLLTSTTGTLNKSKFLRLFLSNKSSNASHNNSTKTNDKTINKISTSKQSTSSVKVKSTSNQMNNKLIKTGSLRTKNMNSTSSKQIPTISGNPNKQTVVSVSS